MITSASGAVLQVCRLQQAIRSDVTLTNRPGTIYEIAVRVEVGKDVGGGSGVIPGGVPVTLTIEPGVVLFGGSGGRLFIQRGSRINAVGTPTKPIIFTSRRNVLGAAAGGDARWGGLALLGRAPLGQCAVEVPGVVPVGGTEACFDFAGGEYRFGGNVAADSSGTLQYVQIRYTDRIGLELDGVGSATTIDHVQVAESIESGATILGGRVNLSHIAVTGDETILTTNYGYRGTIQFLVAAQRNLIGNNLIEVDANGREDELPRQYLRISNATILRALNGPVAPIFLVRGGADAALLNSVIGATSGGGTAGCLDLDETGGTTTRAANAGLQDLGPPVFRSVLMGCSNPFTDDGNVAVATIASIFGSGTNNNNATYSPTLTGLVNGANENAAAATNPTTFNADPYATVDAAAPNKLVAVDFVGAIRNAADTRFRGWTCDVSYANFGTGKPCTDPPI